MDTSTSITREDANAWSGIHHPLAKQLILNGVSQNSLLSLVEFSDTVNVTVPFSSHLSRYSVVDDHLNGMSCCDGKTNAFMAIEDAISQYYTLPAAQLTGNGNVILMLTDGINNPTNVITNCPLLKAALVDKQIKLLFVGVQTSFSMIEEHFGCLYDGTWNKLALDSTVFLIESATEIESVVSKVKQITCSAGQASGNSAAASAMSIADAEEGSEAGYYVFSYKKVDVLFYALLACAVFACVSFACALRLWCNKGERRGKGYGKIDNANGAFTES